MTKSTVFPPQCFDFVPVLDVGQSQLAQSYDFVPVLDVGVRQLVGLIILGQVWILLVVSEISTINCFHHQCNVTSYSFVLLFQALSYFQP